MLWYAFPDGEAGVDHVGFLTRRHRFRKITIPTFEIRRLPIPRRNIGVRLSLLSTVKTSLRIWHLLENLKTANQKSDDVHLQLLQTFLAIKHRRIFNVHLHVDTEELRAQASDSMLGDMLPSQMQDFSA